MSKDELARYRKALITDFDGTLKRKIGDTNDGREITRIANEEGFDFTYEEWEAAPKLHPKFVWAFVVAIIVFTNWGLIESQFLRIQYNFQGESIENLKP